MPRLTAEGIERARKDVEGLPPLTPEQTRQIAAAMRRTKPMQAQSEKRTG